MIAEKTYQVTCQSKNSFIDSKAQTFPFVDKRGSFVKQHNLIECIQNKAIQRTKIGLSDAISQIRNEILRKGKEAFDLFKEHHLHEKNQFGINLTLQTKQSIRKAQGGEKCNSLLEGNKYPFIVHQAFKEGISINSNEYLINIRNCLRDITTVKMRRDEAGAAWQNLAIEVNSKYQDYADDPRPIKRGVNNEGEYKINNVDVNSYLRNLPTGPLVHIKLAGKSYSWQESYSGTKAFHRPLGEYLPFIWHWHN